MKSAQNKSKQKLFLLLSEVYNVLKLKTCLAAEKPKWKIMKFRNSFDFLEGLLCSSASPGFAFTHAAWLRSSGW